MDLPFAIDLIQNPMFWIFSFIDHGGRTIARVPKPFKE
jgi:hypothetical protein